MRIIAVLFFTLFSYFFFVTSARATVDPCPASGPFSKLCGINVGSINIGVQAVIELLIALALIVAIIFLIWGGVKWITAGGDKGAIESARSTIIAAIVGLVLAFLAFFIFNFILFLFGVTNGPISIPTLTQ